MIILLFLLVGTVMRTGIWFRVCNGLGIAVAGLIINILYYTYFVSSIFISINFGYSFVGLVS